jgi:putative cardiolipin synthase
MLPRLRAVVGEPEAQFGVVSPYFVPMASGTEAFADLARRGVRVLTNSLSATDVAPVHAGYAKRRKALLAAGVTLFELKSTGAPTASLGDWVKALGGSGASLHAKTLAVDGQRAFVGSFNFDPRSAALNTEMGFVVDSPTLAAKIHSAFETTVPQIAYEVRLAPDGGIEWIDRGEGTERVLTTEPESGLISRALVEVMPWLPIDRML